MLAVAKTTFVGPDYRTTEARPVSGFRQRFTMGICQLDAKQYNPDHQP
jgi:hypothetical protein